MFWEYWSLVLTCDIIFYVEVTPVSVVPDQLVHLLSWLVSYFNVIHAHYSVTLLYHSTSEIGCIFYNLKNFIFFKKYLLFNFYRMLVIKFVNSYFIGWRGEDICNSLKFYECLKSKLKICTVYCFSTCLNNPSITQDHMLLLHKKYYIKKVCKFPCNCI